jgi:hypothetical protein
VLLAEARAREGAAPMVVSRATRCVVVMCYVCSQYVCLAQQAAQCVSVARAMGVQAVGPRRQPGSPTTRVISHLCDGTASVVACLIPELHLATGIHPGMQKPH